MTELHHKQVKWEIPQRRFTSAVFLRWLKTHTCTTLRRVRMCLLWWTRRELNPCPKTSWYNLLRGQSYLLKFPAVNADRQALTLVALLCLTDTRANSRFRCTTKLTHGGSRSPHPRYGRRLWPHHSLRCKSNSIVVVYFWGWTLLRDYPARHAYHTSKSPSKPLRPHLNLSV